MKLVDITSGTEVLLPNTLLWKDETAWVPVVSSYSYSLTGAVIIETGVMQKGRPITLEAPDDTMAWVKRSTLQTLHTWAQSPTRKMTLMLEYPEDTRTFTVMFRHSDKAVESKPVKGFPEHTADSWYTVSLKLIEVE